MGDQIMAAYVLGADIGSGSVKLTMLSREGKIAGTAQCEYPTLHPAVGWNEQDPEDWCRAFHTALQAAVALTEHSRHHEGCSAYDVFTSATRPDVFLICETWTDAASLDKHAATPEFKKYSPMMRQCGEMKVERFEF